MTSAPVIIHINTALQDAVLSISRGNQLVETFTNNIQKEHASIVHTVIRDLLRSGNLEMSQVDAISVVAGPGSYTGLRVGIASAKGLSYALHKPIISIGTLELMAMQAIRSCNFQDQYYCPMIDARRMEVYTAIYDNKLQEVMKPTAVVLDKSPLHLLSDKPTIYFGDGAMKLKVHDPAISYHQFTANCQAMIDMSLKVYFNGSFVDVVTLNALYIKEFFTITKTVK